mmetsp:Transcript_3688/g.6999  ORF Transcript_3688/g.6999 Transcript_3688/m.6999 type:complete len:337 (-) Transcript_3688:99-1109(-)
MRCAFLCVLSIVFLASAAHGFLSSPKLITLDLQPRSTQPRSIQPLSRPQTKLQADLTFAVEKLPGMTKNIVICLAFGGGLIPAAIAANKSMMSTIMGTKGEAEVSKSSTTNSLTSLDPTSADNVYVRTSAASGPTLSVSPLLFSGDVKLVDVVAVVGRITDVDSVADWANLPSTRVPDLAVPDKPPMWLPRATFKTNLRKAKFVWPVDEDGVPVGGQELYDAENKRISARNAQIPDNALDAVFDTWAWGASIGTPDKVEAELNKWRRGNTFSVGAFGLSAVSGRSVTGLAIITFIVIQVAAYGVLFIAPFLREFINVDIGFGTLGSCNPEGCVKLF